jgi:hypothetical protein
MSSWKERYAEMNASPYIDLDDQFEKVAYGKNDEPALVGLKPDGGGNAPTVVCKNNGCIELFAGPKLGIRIDPKYGTISFFGSKITMLADTIDFNTSPYAGMRWNKFPMNMTFSLGLETAIPGTPLPGTITLDNQMPKDVTTFINKMRNLR